MIGSKVCGGRMTGSATTRAALGLKKRSRRGRDSRERRCERGGASLDNAWGRWLSAACVKSC